MPIGRHGRQDCGRLAFFFFAPFSARRSMPSVVGAGVKGWLTAAPTHWATLLGPAPVCPPAGRGPQLSAGQASSTFPGQRCRRRAARPLRGRPTPAGPALRSGRADCGRRTRGTQADEPSQETRNPCSTAFSREDAQALGPLRGQFAVAGLFAPPCCRPGRRGVGELLLGDDAPFGANGLQRYLDPHLLEHEASAS